MRIVQLFGTDEQWLAPGTGSSSRGDEEGPTLIIVRFGSIEFEDEGERHTVGPLQALIVQPGENFEVAASESTALTRVLLPADCTLE